MKALALVCGLLATGCDTYDCPESEKLPVCEQHLNFTVCDNAWVCPEVRNEDS